MKSHEAIEIVGRAFVWLRIGYGVNVWLVAESKNLGHFPENSDIYSVLRSVRIKVSKDICA